MITVYSGEGLEESGKCGMGHFPNAHCLNSPLFLPPIREIDIREFWGYSQLVYGGWHFTNSHQSNISQYNPPVKAIRDDAFGGCSGVTIVDLGNKLEEIEVGTFL
jgi:hypothetical protein